MPAKKPDIFSLFLIGSIILIIALSSYLIYFVFRNPQLFPNLPGFLRQPVSTNSITGAKITKISGNEITVEVSFDSKTTSYKILTSDSTTINQAPPYIPYNLPSNTQAKQPDPLRKKLSDLKVNDIVSITTNIAVPPTTNTHITALSITLPQPTSAFSGQVNAVEEEALTVTLPNEKGTIRVRIDSQTELTTPQNAHPVSISFHEIKVGNTVNVYADADITQNEQVYAYKLDLVPPPFIR